MISLKPEVLVGPGRGLRFGESPRWRGDRLWFIDIHDCAIKSVSLSGDLRTEIALPFKPNGLGFRSDGAVVFSDALKLRMYSWRGGRLDPIADLSDQAVFCLSDAIVDGRDRTFVSDIGYNFWIPEAEPSDSCVIARIDPGGGVAKVAEGLRFPNGLVITPDGKTLIIAETDGGCLTAFDLTAEGGLSNRRVYAELPEGVRPDGICLDAEGAIWVANPAGGPAVLRVREGGAVTDRIELDSNAYAVMLGGADGRRLFICASASHDPAEIAANPSATLLVCDVTVPSAHASR